MKKLKNISGLTLIEILLGIVISVIMMGAMKERNDARDEARRTQPRKLKPIGFNDPSAVAFRRQHNISDDIGAGC